MGCDAIAGRTAEIVWFCAVAVCSVGPASNRQRSIPKLDCIDSIVASKRCTDTRNLSQIKVIYRANDKKCSESPLIRRGAIRLAADPPDTAPKTATQAPWNASLCGVRETQWISAAMMRAPCDNTAENGNGKMLRYLKLTELASTSHRYAGESARIHRDV